jgi:hypothetical protein
MKQMEEDYEGLFGQFVRIDSVVLPPWADNRHHLVYKMALGLEHPQVSQTLNNWIDLIFGEKQQNPEAYNVFKPLTSERYVRQLDDSKLTPSEISQITEFGNNPIQLLDKAHPVIEDQAKNLFDPFTDSQAYSSIECKVKEPNTDLVIRIIAKDKYSIYMINENWEINRKQ